MKDNRKLMNPDEFTAIPNDLVDKGYMKLFREKKVLEVVLDLIRQSYRAGLEIGREEMRQKHEKELDEIYK